MPPALDVYVIANRRDAVTVNRFLDLYVDRAASEDRGDEELMMLPLGATCDPGKSEDWVWQPAHTLTHVVERGLEQPSRAFAVYLTPRDPAYLQIILAFTTNGLFIAGVSLDDPDENPATLARARETLHRLQEQLDATAGFIGTEVPPPLDGAIPAGHPWLIEVWGGEGAG